jgi:hypothetical protein
MVCAEPFKERRTRLIQRTFKGMRTIGTRSAQDIGASGLTYRINRPDPSNAAKRLKVLARTQTTRNPAQKF